MNEWTVHFQAKGRPIDSEFLARIGAVAEEFGVTVDSKTRQTIEEAEQNRKRRIEEFIRMADEFANKVGPIKSNSADDIRELRDNL